MSIEKLKAAYAAATPGPWEELFVTGLLYGTDEDGAYLVCDVIGDRDYEPNQQDLKNAEFIALAHKMMPELLDAVFRLEGLDK